MFLKHSFFYLLAKGFPGLINLLAISIYTRLISPDSYGSYVLVIAGAGLANSILFQWLRLGLLRFFSSYKDREAEFLSTILAIFLGLVCFSGLLGFIGILLVSDPVIRGFIALGLVLLWLDAFFGLNLELARSQLSPKRYGLLNITKSFIALGLGGTLAYLGFGPYGLLLGLMVGFLCSTLWLMRQSWEGIMPHFGNAALFSKLLKYGLPLTATFALGFVVSSSDRFLLSWLLGTKEAGMYAVGYDLTKQTLDMLMVIVNLAAYPLVVRAFEQEGREATVRQLSKNATLLCAIGFPSTAGLILLAPNISEVFLGTAFRSTATDLIPWIAIATLLAGLKAYYFDISFQIGHQTMGQVWVAFVTALVNFCLNLLWIPRFGLLGAAYATVLAYTLSLGLSWYWGRKVFSLPFPLKDFVKLALATLGMLMVLSPFKDLNGPLYLSVQIVLGAFSFGFLTFLLDVDGVRVLALRALANTRRVRL